MKFSIALALFAAATAVSAETNAQRLARGLSPKAPGKRATPALTANKRQSSPYPGGPCDTGSAHCCNQVQTAGSGQECDGLMHDLGVDVLAGTPVGVSCTGIAGSGADCSQQPVCCEGNSFSGVIVLGCSPVTIL